MNHSASKPTSDQFENLAVELLKGLDTRSQDIIRRRFGLQTGTKETLESIGEGYSITRERVRQIESQAKKVLSNRLDILKPVADLLDSIFAQYGGLLTPEQVVENVRTHIGAGVTPASVNFYLEVLPTYEFSSEDALFAPHWRTKTVSPFASIVIRSGQDILNKTGHPEAEAEFIANIRQRVPAEVTDVQLYGWLAASKHMRKNPFGQWGMVGWAETTPRGVGDKAYAVLRRHGKPEHFRQITTLINDARFDHKIANAQTVHNELIKDKRFVLVGRGLYGLGEWGYVPGTVADVLESVLRKARRPLTREELIENVLGQRLVKKNTILLSLQDHTRFVKTPENRYTLRSKS